jgi:cell division septum initiation protein DivIVA
MQKNDGNHNNANNNGLNGANNGDESLHVGERVFRKTKLGLAEEEVRSYVDELIGQRDALLKRQEHLAALTELAEKTVIEANNLSQLMMKKTTEQAKVEADKIRVKAEQDSEQMLKSKKAEAKAIADKEAEAIKAEAQHQAKIVREQQLDGIRSEAAALAQKLQNELIANIDGIKKHVMTIGSKFEATVSNNSGNTGTTPAAAADTAAKPADALSAGEKGALLDHIPWLEVEVLPPLDIEKIMDLISRLESLPEVKTTDLLPETPNPLIRVFLNEPSPLAEMLRTLPQVEKVTEMSDPAGNDVQAGDKRERIQIVLGKNPNKNTETKKGSTIKATQ